MSVVADTQSKERGCLSLDSTLLMYYEGNQDELNLCTLQCRFELYMFKLIELMAIVSVTEK